MKSSLDEPKIPILTEVERFNLHLADAENKRIMLSAGFGTGKSFFLSLLQSIEY